MDAMEFLQPEIDAITTAENKSEEEARRDGEEREGIVEAGHELARLLVAHGIAGEIEVPETRKIQTHRKLVLLGVELCTRTRTVNATETVSRGWELFKEKYTVWEWTKHDVYLREYEFRHEDPVVLAEDGTFWRISATSKLPKSNEVDPLTHEQPSVFKTGLARLAMRYQDQLV